MNDFKNTYQSAMRDMKEFHLDVSDCLDEKKHKKRVFRHVQRLTAASCSVLCVVFVCSIGTAKAASYIRNVIEVSARGFESSDLDSIGRNARGQSNVYVLDEQMEGTSEQMEGISEQMESASEQMKSASEQMESASEQMKMSSAGKKDNIKPAAGMAKPAVGEEPMAEAAGMAMDTEKTAKEAVKTESLPVTVYNSFEEFRKYEDIVFPQPSFITEAETDSVDVSVCGKWAMACYRTDGKTLWLERTDYTNTAGHSSSKSFPEGVCNRRVYTTGQGYTFTVVDSVRISEKEPLKLHAALSVGNYEVYIDSEGYTETEAKKIMDSIDLSLYEQAESEALQ